MNDFFKKPTKYTLVRTPDGRVVDVPSDTVDYYLNQDHTIVEEGIPDDKKMEELFADDTAPELKPDHIEVANKCPLCDFIGKSPSGLRLHKVRHR